MESSGGSPSPLSDEQREELKEARSQLGELSSLLNKMLMPWNHGGDAEYESLQEAAKAAEAAEQATQRIE